MSDLLTLDHVRAAHARIRDSIVETPTLHSQTLSKLTGANIYLKFENLQFTAAYKECYTFAIGRTTQQGGHRCISWQSCPGTELSWHPSWDSRHYRHAGADTYREGDAD